MTSPVIFGEAIMRGARLLHLLMLLQNRGRMTAATLARELEVSRRTILRDLDAITEAGLPVVALPGAGGGIELGFDYRSRMTALTGDEAEALGLMLASPHPALDRVGLGLAARRAGRKIVEGLAPDVRARIATAEQRFVVRADPHPDDDPRPPALARAVRERRVVQLRSRSRSPMAVHPVQLTFDGRDWDVTCGRTGMAHRRPDWADIAISARRFEPE